MTHRTMLLPAACIALAIAMSLPGLPGSGGKEPPVGQNGPQFDQTWMEVTYDFPPTWGMREPLLITYQGALFLFLEGRLTTNPPDKGYLGGIFYRTMTERVDPVTHRSSLAWGPINHLTETPPPRYIDHANQKIAGAVYKDRLYIFWQSVDSNRTGTEVSNIVMTVYNGTGWSPLEIVSTGAGYTGLGTQPQAIVYDDRLWVIWTRQLNETANSRDIVIRDFDGTEWSGAQVLSRFPAEDTFNEWPALGVYGGRLYAAWQEEIIQQVINHVVAVYDPAAGWSAPQALGTSPVGIINLISQPAFATYVNRLTGLEELALVYITRGEGTAHATRLDTDVLLQAYDGTRWRSIEVSLRDDAEDDQGVSGGSPTVIRYDDRAYIMWASRDPGTAPGSDYDIVVRVWDGATLGGVRILSHIADRDVPVSIDSEPWNLGTDDWPRFGTYNGRLYATWKTLDNTTTVRDNGAVGEPWSMLLRVVEDTDRDGDLVPDLEDHCPADPSDWEDTDRDGTCDHHDDTPTGGNLPRWHTGENVATVSVVWWIVGALLLLAVLAAIWAFLGGIGKPG